jgi:hypothetical protein
LNKPGKGWQVCQAREQCQQNDQKQHAAEQNQRLRIAQRVEQNKKDERYQQNVNNTQPVCSLEDE